MPRKSIPSATLMQAVRRHFGLEQQELAAYLGISRQHVASIEAGRRVMTGPVLLRLNPLAVHLPAAAETAGPAPRPLSPPDPALLDARLDYCRHHAARLRRALRKLDAQATLAARWAALPPAAIGAASPPAQATPLTPAEAARYHLLRLQAEALETEAAALAALLG
jgi:DNA-binding XRE family transcriptional regulator